jgi:hypothetical protein
MKYSSSSFVPPSGALLHRKCACGNRATADGECDQCRRQKQSALQGGAKVSEPSDAHEQEAERVAEQMSAASDHHATSASLPIRPLADQSGEAGTLPGSAGRALSSAGSPLEPALRHDMERRFGHDFSKVRVHSGAPAEESARDVTADAYTVGHDIVFGAGQYAPTTQAGRRLIAHELTHVVQSSGATGRMATPTHSNVLMRQPTEEKPAPTVEADPCTDPDPMLPIFKEGEEKQRAAVLKDMLRGATADEKKAWCKRLRRAMAGFSTGQLLKMKAAGVRFWRSGEYPPPFKGDYAPSKPKRYEMARYQPNTRVIQWGPQAGVDEVRHELAHAWDHVRGGKVPRLDNYKGQSLKKAVLAEAKLSSETAEKRLTIEETVGNAKKKVGLSIQDMFDRFMNRPVRSGSGWSFANTRTDPEHVLSGVKEFYAEGYSVFHGDNEDAQAQLLCDAPELYQMLENEAIEAKLTVPDRAKLTKNNQDNNRKCG